MYKLSLFAQYLQTATASAEGAENSTLAMVMQFAPFIILIIVFYFMLIRPQRKREKAENEMRNNLEVGDVITTRGGIIGTVRQIKDDNLVIETGANNVRITITRWSVGSKEEKISN